MYHHSSLLQHLTKNIQNWRENTTEDFEGCSTPTLHSVGAATLRQSNTQLPQYFIHLLPDYWEKENEAS